MRLRAAQRTRRARAGTARVIPLPHRAKRGQYTASINKPPSGGLLMAAGEGKSSFVEQSSSGGIERFAGPFFCKLSTEKAGPRTKREPALFFTVLKQL